MGKSAKFELKDAFEANSTSSNLVPGTEKNVKSASSEAFLVSDNKNGVKNGVSFKNYRALLMSKRELKLFKDPQIIRCKNGDWYVEYYFRHPDDLTKWVPFKERCGLNYIKDLAEKEKEAETLRMDAYQWLMLGNSPFDEDAKNKKKIITTRFENQLAEKIQDVEKINQQFAVWSIDKSIDNYLKYIEANLRNEDKKDGFSQRTYETYKNYLTGFKTWCIENDLLTKDAWIFNEFELEQFLNDRADLKEWSGRTYNNYLEFFGGFFSKCSTLENRLRVKAGELKINYQLSIECIELKKVTMQRNKPFTAKQIEKIKHALKETGFNDLSDYCEWISLTMMRPDEIRHLKVGNIDHVSRQISIVGKTGARIIPISDQALSLIKSRGIINNNERCYVFGYAGKLDKRRMSVDYFLEQFAVIRKKADIGPEFGPYNFKHTAVQAMSRAGFTDQQIMAVTGHKTLEAFRAYMAYFHIDHSHVMKGSTIDF